MALTPEQRADALQAAMQGAYDPARQYGNWLSLGENDLSKGLSDIGVIGDYKSGNVSLTGAGQLGKISRQRNIGLARMGEDERHTNLLTRGSYGARGLFGSGLLKAQNSQTRQGYARQRDDLNMGFSDQTSELLKNAHDLLSRFNIEQGQKYEDYEKKKPLNQLGAYGF